MNKKTTTDCKSREPEHITELHYNSKRYNMSEKGADQMPSYEESKIQ